MSTPVKLAMLLIVAFVVALGGLLLWDRTNETPSAGGKDAEPRVLRDDSRVIGTEGSSDVVLTEFLDFECEACRAAFPIVDDLRQKYDGQVTFTARYFPLTGHFNPERSARARDSAARTDPILAMSPLIHQPQRD